MINFNEYISKFQKDKQRIENYLAETEQQLNNLLNEKGMERVKMLFDKTNSLKEELNNFKIDIREKYFKEGIIEIVEKSIKDIPYNTEPMYKNGYVLLDEITCNKDYDLNRFFNNCKGFFAYYITMPKATEEEKYFINNLAKHCHSNLYEICYMFNENNLMAKQENITFADVVANHLPNNLKLEIINTIENIRLRAFNDDKDFFNPLNLMDVYSQDFFAEINLEYKIKFLNENISNIHRDLFTGNRQEINISNFEKLNEMLQNPEIKTFITNEYSKEGSTLIKIEKEFLDAQFISDSILDENKSVCDKPECITEFLKIMDDYRKVETREEKENNIEI